MEQAKTFLSRAVPWPGPNDDWWINIHSTWKTPSGRVSVPGRAFKDLDEAARHIEWKLKQQPSDIYVCMSGQRLANQKSNAKGRLICQAIRRAENATMLRSIWLDVDVKQGAFATTEAALKAFGEFRRKALLPLPTYVVMSGSGGFHVHWVFEDPIPLALWTRLAHGLVNATKALKFEPLDTGVSIDAARLLRIPDTFNQKTSPPNPVWLARRGDLFAVDAIQRPLTPYFGRSPLPVLVHTPAGTPTGIMGKASPLFASSRVKADALDAGIEEPPSPSIDDVATECRVIDDAIQTGGRGLAEPVWLETLKVAYYCDGNRQAAHDLSELHDGYSQAATDEKFDRVVRDHGTGKYGWPQCDTIWKAGATQCPSCPHHGKGKSPLNFVGLVTAQSQVPPPPVPPGFTGNGKASPMPVGFGYLPYPYTHDAFGYPQRDMPEDPEDPASKLVPTRVCTVPVWHLWAQEVSDTGGLYALNFSTPVNSKRVSDVQLGYDDLADTRKLNTKLAQYGVMLQDTRSFRTLMASFVEELMAKKHAAAPSENYGWSVEQGEEVAFVYGKVRWNCVGNTRVVPPDSNLAQQYHPCGDLDVWRSACRLITDQKRPALDMILACGLGAPLVNLTGHSGFVVCAYSPESGVQKSSAMIVTQAMWGHPVSAMAGLDDTANYVNARLGVLRHLPFLYDELKLEEQSQKFVNMIFGMGQGKTKGRLSRSAVAQKVDSFATLMIAASNNSLIDYIADHTKLTTAGLYRVFEFKVDRRTSDEGVINGATAQAMLGKLRTNYGNAGLTYAEFLGQNAKLVKEQVSKAYEDINTMLKGTSDERFWVATIAVALMGAKYGNDLGLTRIDIPRLSKFLTDEFRRMRTKRDKSSTDITTAGTLDEYVSDYVNTRRQQTVITDLLWTAANKPPAGYVVRLLNNMTHMQGRLTVHAAKQDLLLRISVSDFKSWLREKRGVSPGMLLDQILKTLPAKLVTSRIGIHTSFQLSREPLLEFDLARMPDFFDFN